MDPREDSGDTAILYRRLMITGFTIIVIPTNIFPEGKYSTSLGHMLYIMYIYSELL